MRYYLSEGNAVAAREAAEELRSGMLQVCFGR